MTVEMSSMLKLLHELGQDDTTCRRFALRAECGESILTVCQAALRALVDDKNNLRKLVITMVPDQHG